MVYFKLLLNDKRPKSDNIYPIEVRVTFNRKNTTLSPGIRVSKDLWDGSLQKVKHTHPNAQQLNKTITEFNSKVQKVALDLIQEVQFSFEELKRRVQTNYQPIKIVKAVSFKEFADKLIAEMFEDNKAGNATVYQTATNRLIGFAPHLQIKFTDVTYTFLDGFKRQLIKEGVKVNSISNYFRTLRAIYNKAIKAKLVSRDFYPFLDIQVKTERTAKRALSIDSLVKIVNVRPKPNTQAWHARNMFLLSFALRGASFTDLGYLTYSNIHKGYLIYKRRKTGKEMTIKISEYIDEILCHYKEQNSKYLLPILPVDTIENSKSAKLIIGQWIKTTNKYLLQIARTAEVDDLVTTYVARHTWATTAKRLGYSIELIAEAMGHEHGNKITNIYLDTFDQSLIDEMNRKVIERII